MTQPYGEMLKQAVEKARTGGHSVFISGDPKTGFVAQIIALSDNRAGWLITQGNTLHASGVRAANGQDGPWTSAVEAEAMEVAGQTFAGLKA